MSATPAFPARLAAARFRAWHRGTREADLVIGGFFDRFHAAWGEEELSWFETILEADEADVLDWALGIALPPAKVNGRQLEALKKLNFVTIP